MEVAYEITPPNYSLTCECGMTIQGQSEKGTVSLIKRHVEKGVYHLDWLKKNGH